MLPALIAQHPQLARGIILYRFQRLKQAQANAKAAHLPGAQYPWESADTGVEEAPEEFAQERHITADVALAAWQYYLWSGDKQYLHSEGWPILENCADYWAARSAKGSDGKYHILRVIGPDETSGVVDDDAWTNAAAAQCLRDAALGATALALPSEAELACGRGRFVNPARRRNRHPDRARRSNQQPASQAGRHGAFDLSAEFASLGRPSRCRFAIRGAAYH